MNKKIGIILLMLLFAIVVISANEYSLNEQQKWKTTKTVLDFSELEKFNSVEETENYRFEMRVEEVYRLQDHEYHYLGDGKMLIKSYSDPEFVKEYRWLLQIGNKPTIGTGRSYFVTVIEVRSAAILFRIEMIKNEE